MEKCLGITLINYASFKTFSLYIGAKPELQVLNTEIIKEITITRFNKFSSRQVSHESLYTPLFFFRKQMLCNLLHPRAYLLKRVLIGNPQESFLVIHFHPKN